MDTQDKLIEDTLVITGGTGSFGKAVLIRALREKRFKSIRVLSRDEKKQDDLRRELNCDKIEFFLGDVRDPSSLECAFEGATLFFHAAALKQVPSCEFYPLEAVKTNILGSSNVLAIAKKLKLQKGVFLSTDKAAYPVNAMGISKSMMERIVISDSRHGKINECINSITRYGNVIGSRGSVIPLFINLIKTNKPLLITNPEMTRFMMTLDEAVDLVFHSFQNARNGEIFVQKSPACTVQVLCEALFEIFGKNTGVKIIGTRPGEKMHETLLTREELSRSFDEGKYYRVVQDSKSLDYSQFFDKGNSKRIPENNYTSLNTVQLTKNEVVSLLQPLPIIQKHLS